MDILICSALGADMYDSVYPTRTARFGVALVPGGTLKLRNRPFAEDFRWGAQSCPWQCDPACGSSGVQGSKAGACRSGDANIPEA